MAPRPPLAPRSAARLAVAREARTGVLRPRRARKGSPHRRARPSLASGRLPTKQERLLAVLVQPIEQWARQPEQLVVIADHREPPEEHVEPARLRSVVALIGEVGLVHHLADLPQHRIVKLVDAQERLEAAGATVVGEI